MPRIQAYSSKPTIQSVAAILGGTLIGPVIEDQSVKILTNVDLELQSHHPMIRNAHLMFLISRGKSRFVDEVHNPNAEIRSSADLLSELQKAEGG